MSICILVPTVQHLTCKTYNSPTDPRILKHFVETQQISGARVSPTPSLTHGTDAHLPMAPDPIERPGLIVAGRRKRDKLSRERESTIVLRCKPDVLSSG